MRRVTGLRGYSSLQGDRCEKLGLRGELRYEETDVRGEFQV